MFSIEVCFQQLSVWSSNRSANEEALTPPITMFGRLLRHVTWGVSSNQNCRDPGDSPGHASSLVLRTCALRSCYWTSWYTSCDFRRFVESEMQRPRCFTWLCFFLCYVVLRCAVAIWHVDISHVTWGVSSNQKCRDPGDSPGHASSLVLISSALRSCYWTCWYKPCDSRRFVQSEVRRPRWFTKSYFH